MQSSDALEREVYRRRDASTRGRRILFLDDDPARATHFLSKHPGVVWVQSVADCIRELGSPWDEVHLDHDLAGETYVSTDRGDCGMEVVRWLCEEPRPHLKSTEFIVHTRNENAACVMILHLEEMGFRVTARPFSFGRGARQIDPNPSLFDRLAGWFSSEVASN